MAASQEEINQNIQRQKHESLKIGKTIRAMLDDMCVARNVSDIFLSPEIIAHALDMVFECHKRFHETDIKDKGVEKTMELEDRLSAAAMNNLLQAGAKMKNSDSPAATFGILSGSLINNENLADSLYLNRVFSICERSDKGFVVNFIDKRPAVEITVRKKVILLSVVDHSWDNIEDAAVKCAWFNTKSTYVKAQLMDEPEKKIRFLNVYSYANLIKVSEIKALVIRIVEEMNRISFGEDT